MLTIPLAGALNAVYVDVKDNHSTLKGVFAPDLILFFDIGMSH